MKSRFTDKVSVYALAGFLGFFGYGVAVRNEMTAFVLSRLGGIISDPTFILAMVISGVCLMKLNVLIVLVLAVAGYAVAANWPVADYPQLVTTLSVPDPVISYLGSPIAWIAYAFAIMLSLVDVLRIASDAVRGAADPGIRR